MKLALDKIWSFYVWNLTHIYSSLVFLDKVKVVKLLPWEPEMWSWRAMWRDFVVTWQARSLSARELYRSYAVIISTHPYQPWNTAVTLDTAEATMQGQGQGHAPDHPAQSGKSQTKFLRTSWSDFYKVTIRPFNEWYIAFIYIYFFLNQNGNCFFQ